MMKKRRLISRLSAIVAFAMCLSLLASCDMMSGALKEEADTDAQSEVLSAVIDEVETEKSDKYTDGLEFSRDRYTNEYSVVGYSGVSTTVEIPATYMGNPVTSIAKNAFFKTEASVIKLPDTIKVIGDNAFKNSTTLREVYIGKNSTQLEQIGKDAFFSCNALEVIYFFGDDSDWSRVELGKNWDKNAGSLNPNGGYSLYIVDSDKVYTEIASESEWMTEDVSVPESESEWQSEDHSEEYPFDGEITTEDWYETTAPELESVYYELDSDGIRYQFDYDNMSYRVIGAEFDANSILNIPEEFNGYPVTEIYENAFENHNVISQVYLSKNIKKIGANAFANCTSIEEVYYGYDSSSWNLIDIETGNECLTSADFTFNYLRVSEGLQFQYCDLGGYMLMSLGECYDADIFIPAEYNGYPVVAIGHGAILSNVDSIYIPASVIYIHSQMLNYGSVKSFVVSEDNPVYRSIDGHIYSCDGTVFYHYASGKANTMFSVPGGVKEIASYAFDSVSNLKTVTISSGVTVIGEHAFSKCNNLVSIVFGSGISYLPSYAVEYCNKLETVYLGDGVSEVGYHAFSRCTSLKTISIGKNITSINRDMSDAFSPLEQILVSESNAVYSSKDGVVYSKDGKTIVLVPKEYANDDFVIPDGVETIGYYAFANVNISNVYLPETLETIETNAFYGSTVLSISLNDYLETIEERAFENCVNLVTVQIPEGISYIGAAPFNGCTSLKEIKMSGNGEYEFFTVDGNLYRRSDMSLVQYAIGKTDEIFRMPNDVWYINSGAIQNCSNLRYVFLSDNLYNADYGTLSNCENLEVIFYVGDWEAWNGSLVDKFPTDVSIITQYKVERDDLSWYYSYNEGNGSVTISGFASVGDAALIIPHVVDELPVTAIGDYAFHGHTEIEYVYIHENIESIHYSAFLSCTNLKYIEVSENNPYFKSINGVLYSKDGSELLLYPAGRRAQSFVTPEAVEKIGNSAFYDNNYLNKVFLSDNVTVIGEAAFSFCTQMKAIYLPYGLVTIENGAFYGCWNLDNVIIPDSVATIGDNAFSNCSSLTTIIFGSGVEYLGQNVVEYCYGPTTIYYVGSESEWESIEKHSANAFLFDDEKVFNYQSPIYGYDKDGNYGYQINVWDGEASYGVSVQIENKDANAILSANGDYDIYGNYVENIRVQGNDSRINAGEIVIDPDSAYLLPEKPVLALIVKNFCTCDGGGECYALESVNTNVTSGNKVFKINEMDMCYDPYYVNGDTYLLFYCDISDYVDTEEISSFSFEFVCGNWGENDFEISSIQIVESDEQADVAFEKYVAQFQFEQN